MKDRLLGALGIAMASAIIAACAWVMLHQTEIIYPQVMP